MSPGDKLRTIARLLQRSKSEEDWHPLFSRAGRLVWPEEAREKFSVLLAVGAFFEAARLLVPANLEWTLRRNVDNSSTAVGVICLDARRGAKSDTLASRPCASPEAALGWLAVMARAELANVAPRRALAGRHLAIKRAAAEP